MVKSVNEQMHIYRQHTDLRPQPTCSASLHHIAAALKLLKLLAQHAQHAALGALNVQQVLAVVH